MLSPALLEHAAAVLDACRSRGLRLATVESCTGGLIVAALTAIDGSSDVVDRGFIAYSNDAKTDLVGVPAELIAGHGAVSEAVAAAMATGALTRSRAQIAVSATGLAGPGGGSAQKPVGLVWIGLAQRDHPVSAERHVFSGDRAAVRAAAVAHALMMIRARVSP